jgi:hypothetical protein
MTNPRVNTRKIGDDLENKVLEILEPYFSKTAGSGSVFKDGDLRNSDTVGEIKVRGTMGASITGTDLRKLVAEAKKQGKDWLFICENYPKNLIAMLDLNTYAVLYEENKVAEALREEDYELYMKLYQKVRK